MNQTNQQPIQEPSFESKQNSNKLLLTIIISVLATLIIVGLAMYFVMAKVNSNNQENLQKQIQYLQQKIDVLENQEQVKIDNSDIDNVIDEVVQEKQEEQVDEFEINCNSDQKFVSEKLGIAFCYPKIFATREVVVKEIGNKVYVDGLQGQSV
ncbi:hypothetical protein L6278_01810, partial [Candidatus Parcubacteria bacterium]|nr:hypothetical protein [Candidatus Parcubacteria bacterium]